jgi:hypothetical protein
MRLINSQTLQLEEFIDGNIPTYSILSHTWGPEEVSFSDYTSNRAVAESKDGYRKIRLSCEQARKDDISYVWVDTCCIDKSSSAELTESINSMFKWYQDSDTCYAYLTDVSKANFDIEFPKSCWFSRGWTLQELLAPTHVDFYDQDWCEIGSKLDHAELISEITRIDVKALCLAGETHGDFTDVTLASFCVAKRMSWASNRKTTRVEDMAYCLLGIFKVNMPLLYGEGERAFIRLQEEIIRNNDDDSILAWGLDTEISHGNGLIPEQIAESICGSATMGDLFATSPKKFENCQDLEYLGESYAPIMLTNLGLQMELPLVPVYTPESRLSYYGSDEIHGWVGLLSCSAGIATKIPGIVFWSASADDEKAHLVERMEFGFPSRKDTFLVDVSAATRATLTKTTILRRNESQSVRRYCSGYRHTIINVSEALRDAGYRISTASGENVKGIGWSSEYYPGWDPVKHILTIQGDHITEDLVRICFELAPGTINHEFSVFVRAQNAIVREGPSFSEAERRIFYDYLGDKSQKEDDDDPVIFSTDGSARGRYRIAVSIDKKVVFRWCMYKVSVDAVRCEAARDLQS